MGLVFSQPRAWPSVALRPDTHPAAPGTGAHLAGVAAGVVSAGGPVLAGAGRALVHLLLAVAARVASLAVAVVCVARVHAEAPVPAQVGHVDACGARGGRSVRPRLPSPGAASGSTPPDLRVRTPGGHREAWAVTLLPRGHLTGDAGHVAVEASPATVALAAVHRVGLPAPAVVLAGGGVAPAHEGLGTRGGLAHAPPAGSHGPSPPGGGHTRAPETLMPKVARDPHPPNPQKRTPRPTGRPLLGSNRELWGPLSCSGPLVVNPDNRLPFLEGRFSLRRKQLCSNWCFVCEHL